MNSLVQAYDGLQLFFEQLGYTSPEIKDLDHLLNGQTVISDQQEHLHFSEHPNAQVSYWDS